MAQAAACEKTRQENVFKVCDQPHPLLVATVLGQCNDGKLEDAHDAMLGLWQKGYSATDIVTTMFRVAKNYDLPEFVKLEFIREIGFAHMRIADGNTSFLQVCGLLAKLCKVAAAAKAQG